MTALSSKSKVARFSRSFLPQGKYARFSRWFRVRGARYAVMRLRILLERYGISAARAKKRTEACVRALARYQCYPTFPTPGHVVEHNARFSRKLQAMGVELAVHGYGHVDFKSISPAEAARQFERAAAAYERSGIRFDGFRCPYLSFTDVLPGILPGNSYGYSSNKAIWWDVVPSDLQEHATPISQALHRFYRADSSESTVATPFMRGNLVEIPVSLPDDIQLHDGIGLDPQGIARAWLELLWQTHKRGELFVLMFHPESFDRSRLALECVAAEARRLDPPVWVTQLRDVSSWWREKSRFSVEVKEDSCGTEFHFSCSDRATVLARNLEYAGHLTFWDSRYSVLEGRSLRLRPGIRPFVGLPAQTPARVVSFLTEQGYFTDTSEQAAECGVYIEPEAIGVAWNEVGLINFIEGSDAPLVKFSRWPGRARSALCVTGDLDALSLVDYALRIFTT